MHTLFRTALCAAGLLVLCSWSNTPSANVSGKDTATLTADTYRSLYEKVGMEDFPYNAFTQAVAGYELISDRRKDILVIIDYSKPSTAERLYVIDVPNKNLLYKSLVAHGRGSGDNYATSFSNVPGSHQSSLGFYLTGATYQGRNGLSLRLSGLEKGINDNAYDRAIVIHGADYCASSFIASAGRLGRSFGCPAIPQELNEPIINTIKDGAVLFIYGEDPDYLAHSSVLSAYASNKQR